MKRRNEEIKGEIKMFVNSSTLRKLSQNSFEGIFESLFSWIPNLFRSTVPVSYPSEGEVIPEIQLPTYPFTWYRYNIIFY